MMKFYVAQMPGLHAFHAQVFYLIGVLDALVRLHIVVPGVTPVAGASAGALATVAHCSGLSPPQIREAALGLAHSCQRAGNCFANLDVQVRRLLRATLNPTSPQRCKNKGFVQVSRGSLGRTQPLLVSDFSNLADLTDAAAASAYIPLWSSSTVNTLFRGQQAVDGGVTDNQPCPPNVTYCVKVSLTPFEFTPNSAPALFALFGIARRGPANARVSRPVRLPADGKYNESRVADYHEFDSVDLRPNVYTPVPYTNAEWNEMVLIPGATNTLMAMYDLGKRDGTLWAQRNGLAAAAAAMHKQKGHKGTPAIAKRDDEGNSSSGSSTNSSSSSSGGN
jgi:hypothetical protein